MAINQILLLTDWLILLIYLLTYILTW